MTSGIYRIHNLIDDTSYIGSSQDCEKRLQIHYHCLAQQTHWNKKLQRAWEKYGEDAFKTEILVIAEDSNLLKELENVCIKYFNSIQNGYNVVSSGRQGEDERQRLREERATKKAAKEERLQQELREVMLKLNL